MNAISLLKDIFSRYLLFWSLQCLYLSLTSYCRRNLSLKTRQSQITKWAIFEKYQWRNNEFYDIFKPIILLLSFSPQKPFILDRCIRWTAKAFVSPLYEWLLRPRGVLNVFLGCCKVAKKSHVKSVSVGCTNGGLWK